MSEHEQNGAEKTAGNGRDPITGRFLVGNPGGGRPPIVDFRRLVHRARGATVEEKLLAVFDALCEQAESGDVAAAKLLLERLCGKDAEKLEVSDSRLTATEMRQRLRSLIEDAFSDDET